MKYCFTLDADHASLRLDQALSGLLPDISRGRLQKAIKNGQCLLDGVKEKSPAAKTRVGMEISLEMCEEPTGLMAESGELKILWQDEHIVVCDKPANLTVHPCPSCPNNTLVQRLLSHFPALAQQGGQRPGITHRLDKDTSGLIIVALTEVARLKLVSQFANREINKEYLAVVWGVPPETGESREPLGRHPAIKTRMAVVPEKHGGKPAHSQWRRLWNNGIISLLAVKIFTGRTHQIRVHLQRAGFPIIGDNTYAPLEIGKMASRQLLHAWKLKFTHPVTGEPLSFCSPPPADFIEAFTMNFLRMPRIVITGNQGSGKSTFSREMEKLGIRTISADAIVAGLYSKQGHVTDWLNINFPAALSENQKKVDKSTLFESMQKNPDKGREFTNFVHRLVYDEIEKFWGLCEKDGQIAAVAEIPLYFECGWERFFRPRPIAVGIHCDEKSRWNRIRNNRHWDIEKFSAIESWQWQESRKMQSCDIVIDNNDDPGQLQEQALHLLEKINSMTRNEKKEIGNRLEKLGQEV